MEEKREKILIVDDEPANITILGNLLQSDYEIMVALDGESCLEIVHSPEPPDLILLDISMPGLDGYEVCRRLQAEELTKDIPVIFVTALSSTENESKGLNLGAVDYILKPINTAIVKVRIQNHLEMKRQRNRLLLQQQELLRVNQRNLMILETAAEGIYGIDRDGLITFINPAALDMIGYQENEVLGKNSCKIMHHSKTNGEKCSDSECLVIQAMRQRQFREKSADIFWRQDATSFPVEYVAAPAIEDGATVGAVVVFRDISRRQQLEREAQKADKLKAFEVLSGGIAHDFNNLLSSILGFLELAMLHVQPEEEIYGFLDNSYRSSLQARDLAAKFMTISRNNMESREEICLAEIINQVVESIQAHGDIDFQLNMPESSWSLQASQLHIIQLLQNILLNSQEAMPNGGSIKIIVRNCSDGSQENPNLGAGKYLHVMVQDQGQGISAEDYPKIFDPYFSTKQRGAQKGMGLGLTICHAIIKKYQGLLEVESVSGQGTTVHIYLPVTTSPVKRADMM